MGGFDTCRLPVVDAIAHNRRMATQRFTHGDHVWYDITDPTIHDIAGIRRTFPQISELNLEDALSIIERPKYDQEDDYLFIVLQFPLWDAATKLTRGSEVDFFVMKHAVITIHDGVLKPLRVLAEACSGNAELRAKLLGGSTVHFLYVALDRLTDYMFPILNKIGAQITRIEENIFEPQGEMQLIREISLVRRDAMANRRIIHHMLPIMQQIEHRIAKYVSGDLEDYFGDIVDHVQKAKDEIDEHVEVINALTDTADTLLTHRLNSVIRILTVISTIMLPLSIVVGAFGMNVSLPFENEPNAFMIISGIMIAISVTMLGYFRYRRWL